MSDDLRLNIYQTFYMKQNLFMNNILVGSQSRLITL